MEGLTLNVGCGLQGVGDVNCDLYGEEAHLGGYIIDPHIVRNFVICDAQRLPFRTGAFQTVYSRHVIEHVQDPFLMLKEMVRCSTKYVTVICPHRWHTIWHLRRGHHINFLNKKWFCSVAIKLHCFIRVIYSEMSVLFSLPSELTVYFVKQDWKDILDS